MVSNVTYDHCVGFLSQLFDVNLENTNINLHGKVYNILYTWLE